MRIKVNKLVFFGLIFCGLVIAFSSFYVLPSRFFNDSHTYVNDPHGIMGVQGGYPVTILFYNITGLKHLSFPLIGVIQFLFATLILVRIGIPNRFHELTVKNIIVFLGILILAIFMAMPTKEFITFFFTSLIVFLFRSRRFKLNKSIFICIVLFVLFANRFREYYYLIIITSLFLLALNYIRFKSKTTINIVFGLLFAISLSLSYGVVKGEFLSHTTREKINAWRTAMGQTENNSAIVSPIETDTWYGESFGIVYGFFTVNLPFNAIVKFLFSPQIVAFSIWQLFLFVIIFKRYGDCLNLGKRDNYELWLFYFLISYFIIQGVFEPDLGSAIRHKAGIFPLIYYLMYYEEFRKKIS